MVLLIGVMSLISFFKKRMGLNTDIPYIILSFLSPFFAFNADFFAFMPSLGRESIVFLTAVVFIRGVYILFKVSKGEINKGSIEEILPFIFLWSFGNFQLTLIVYFAYLLLKKIFVDKIYFFILLILSTIALDSTVLIDSFLKSYLVLIGFLFLLVRSFWKNDLVETLIYAFLLISFLEKGVAISSPLYVTLGGFSILHLLQGLNCEDKISFISQLKKRKTLERVYLQLSIKGEKKAPKKEVEALEKRVETKKDSLYQAHINYVEYYITGLLLSLLILITCVVKSWP